MIAFFYLNKRIKIIIPNKTEKILVKIKFTKFSIETSSSFVASVKIRHHSQNLIKKTIQ